MAIHRSGVVWCCESPGKQTQRLQPVCLCFAGTFQMTVKWDQVKQGVQSLTRLNFPLCEQPPLSDNRFHVIHVQNWRKSIRSAVHCFKSIDCLWQDSIQPQAILLGQEKNSFRPLHIEYIITHFPLVKSAIFFLFFLLILCG